MLENRDLLFLRDQASWTSSQFDKAHIVTVFVLTLPYLLLLQTKEQMEKDWMNQMGCYFYNLARKQITLNLLFSLLYQKVNKANRPSSIICKKFLIEIP